MDFYPLLKGSGDFDEHVHPTLEEKYILTKFIGGGSFGTVYQAIAKENPEKMVAVKKVSNVDKNGKIFKNVLREMQILRTLERSHKNVVELIDICTDPYDPKTTYFVLEYCKHDLAGVIYNKNIRLELAEIKSVLQQLFEALHVLQCKQILHRDLKPSNILLTEEGVLKLADFGTSRFLQDGSKRFSDGWVTRWYRPPELLLLAPKYGTPVDMWSAGCVMAELFTRSPLLQGKCDQDMLAKISWLCGSISPEVWPDVTKLELYQSIALPKNKPNRVKEFLWNFAEDHSACDLLHKLLKLDPSERLEAHMALNHSFFWTEPKPQSLAPQLKGFEGQVLTLGRNYFMYDPLNNLNLPSS